MTDWTSSTVCARIAGSSASGIPALTSSICAPASTCAIASATTVSKFPAAISSASFLRPVGLIRSPMITNGRSKPITTSLVGDDSTVSVTRLSFPFARTSRSSTSSVYAASSHSSLLARPRPRGRRRRRAARGATASRYASVPISPARIAAASIASWKRGPDSSARGARTPAPPRPSPAPGMSPPPDHRQLRHRATRAPIRRPRTDGPDAARRSRCARRSNASPRRSAASRPARSSSGSSVWARYTSRR